MHSLNDEFICPLVTAVSFMTRTREVDPYIALTRCKHIFKMTKNAKEISPVHTKTAHFVPVDFENG